MKRNLCVFWMLSVAALSVSLVAAAPDPKPPCRLGDVPVPGFAVPSLPAPDFQRLHAAIAPKGDSERWAELPWETDLAAARQRAAREGKLLLLWIMDGHPLGCT